MKKINEIIKKIEKYKKIRLFTHKNVDGDSLSSSYGLCLALKQKYPKKNIKVISDFDYLKKNFSFMNLDKHLFEKKASGEYLGIIGDTSIQERILYFNELNKAKEIICFDHHQNKINFKSKIFWHEPNYPASSLQAAEIAFALKINFHEKTAIGILFGILTDTNFFKYSTNNPTPPLVYSKLLSYTSHEKMNELIRCFNVKTKYDIKIINFVYKNIKYRNNVSYVYFPKKMVNKYGYISLKNKLGFISNIDNKSVWAFFIHNNDNYNFPIKVSLRSSNKDVNQIAKQYNGGGHIKAAGCMIKNKKQMYEIVKKLQLI